jgi:hypothetical protein
MLNYEVDPGILAGSRAGRDGARPLAGAGARERGRLSLPAHAGDGRRDPGALQLRGSEPALLRPTRGAGGLASRRRLREGDRAAFRDRLGGPRALQRELCRAADAAFDRRGANAGAGRSVGYRVAARWALVPTWVSWRAAQAGIPPADSEATFITEHYWGYARQRDGGTVEYQVEHPQWRVSAALRIPLRVRRRRALRRAVRPLPRCPRDAAGLGVPGRRLAGDGAQRSAT